MKLREVEVFRAVMRTGSMTAAAQVLHTSQPNVSRFIASLERASRLKLFERLPGRVIPTDEATALFREVERVFLGLETLERSAETIRRFSTSRLRIASVGSATASYLPQVIRRFMKEYPNTTLSTHSDSSWGVTNLVASQICDVGLTTHVTDAAGVRAEELCTFDAMCVLPHGHPLVRKRVLRPGDLAGEIFISLPLGHPSRRLIDGPFAAPDQRVHGLEMANSESICNMVETGLGISILNPLGVRLNQHPGLRLRRFEPSIVFSTYLLTSELRPASILCEHFIATTRQVVKEVSRQYGKPV